MLTPAMHDDIIYNMLSISSDVHKHKRGDLIKWYSYYQDEIVSDAGYGIVLERNMHCYRVYTFKDCTFKWFARHDVEAISSK